MTIELNSLVVIEDENGDKYADFAVDTYAEKDVDHIFGNTFTISFTKEGELKCVRHRFDGRVYFKYELIEVWRKVDDKFYEKVWSLN